MMDIYLTEADDVGMQQCAVIHYLPLHILVYLRPRVHTLVPRIHLK